MVKVLMPRPKGFTQINNLLIDDTTLSIDSKGLFLTMWRLPNDWRFTIKGLAKRCGCGKDRVKRMLDDLIQHGYLERLEVRQNGRFDGYDYKLIDARRAGVDRAEDEKVTITTAPHTRHRKVTSQTSSNAVSESVDTVSVISRSGDATPTNTVITKTINTKTDNNNIDLDINTRLARLGVKVSQGQRVRLQRAVAGFSTPIVMHAIDRMAQAASEPSVNYLIAILNSYRRQGLRSLAAVQAESRRFDAVHGSLTQPAPIATPGSFTIPVFKLKDQQWKVGCC